jgi:hypothetical protein
MRALLSTLAIMTIISPAFASEMNKDPEGSIEQSTISAHETVSTPAIKPVMKSVDAATIAKMEPAAGVESPSAKMIQNDVNNYSDPEGTVEPSRMVE